MDTFLVYTDVGVNIGEWCFQRFGKLMGMCRDPTQGTVWVYTSQNVFKYKVTNEAR